MPYTTFPASLRITSDLDRSGSLPHAAALRIVDDHLHKSGMIPRLPNISGARIYLHDWYCVGQAVSSFPTSKLLHYATHHHDLIKSHLWVSSVGKASSITFSSVIAIKNEEEGEDGSVKALATVNRVFVRKNAEDGSPAPFTETERERFLNEYAISGNDRAPPPCNLDHYPLPEVRRLFIPEQQDLEDVATLSVSIGPQGMNFGDHADHAFLAETAYHALFLAAENDSGHNVPALSTPSTLHVQYKSEGMLGMELRCFALKGDHNKVCLFGTRKCGSRQLVLVAERTLQ